MGYLLVAVSVFLLDFFVKRYIDKHKEIGKTEMICHDKIMLRKYYNKGAAFNFLAKTPETMKTIHTFILGLLAGAYACVLKMKEHRLLKLGLSFLIGGGASNLFDRITKKHVVDYFSFPVKWKKLRSLVFNISDLFVFLGAVLAALSGGKNK